MKDLKNTHALFIKYHGATNNGGSRVSITSDRFKERVYISYDYQYNNIYDMAQNYLESIGFNLIGISETKDGYILLSDTFKSIK